MSRLPTMAYAILSRERLTEMVAPTQAHLRNIDVNDAYHRVESALREPSIVTALQEVIWSGLLEEKSGFDERQILDLVERRLLKRRKYKRTPFRASEEGALLAVSFWLDKSAGMSSGEGADLITTDAGQTLLRRGLATVGRHLARELLR